jgi:hypothetical protein
MEALFRILKSAIEYPYMLNNSFNLFAVVLFFCAEIDLGQATKGVNSSPGLPKVGQAFTHKVMAMQLGREGEKKRLCNCFSCKSV